MSNQFTKIEISRSNLLNNVSQCRQNIPADTKIAAVVKANAYGHGVREIVSILEGANLEGDSDGRGADYYQVDDLMELAEIRQYTKKPVLVFGYVSLDQIEEALQLDATLGVYDLDTAEQINKVSEKMGRISKIHIKVDSFLGRQGILVDEAEGFFSKIRDFKNIEVESIYSHFSNIEDTKDLDHAKKQFDGLMQAKQIAQKNGFGKITHHISATSGIMTDGGDGSDHNWNGAIVRFGIGLYGLWPSENLRQRHEGDWNLLPVMRWTTQVAQVKEVSENYPIGYGCTFVTNRPTKIAVIPQGYSDGYDRLLSGGVGSGEVLIRGQRCPVLGRVAMNMFVVDVTDAQTDVKVGDEVVLLGKQKEKRGEKQGEKMRDNEISAEEIADKINTINYEITTRIWPKLDRVVVD
jgi:alanine racemase